MPVMATTQMMIMLTMVVVMAQSRYLEQSDMGPHLQQHTLGSGAILTIMCCGSGFGEKTSLLGANSFCGVCSEYILVGQRGC